MFGVAVCDAGTRPGPPPGSASVPVTVGDTAVAVVVRVAVAVVVYVAVGGTAVAVRVGVAGTGVCEGVEVGPDTVGVAVAGSGPFTRLDVSTTSKSEPVIWLSV